MTAHYSVTFEFKTKAPETHRGTVVAASGATCVSRATKAAQKALRPTGWTSLVCVLLDRADTSTDDYSLTPEDAAAAIAATTGIHDAD